MSIFSNTFKVKKTLTLREKVIKLRKENVSYKKISELTGVSIYKIKNLSK